MIQWRVYYEDGTTFDDTMGGPGDVSPIGVLSIQQRNDCTHHRTEWLKNEVLMGSDRKFVEMLEGADWYWWREDTQRWMRGDLLGWLDQAMHAGARWLKQGRCASHEVWERTIMKVQSDPDFSR